MPSFLIFPCRVLRFSPSRAAAPLGPLRTPLVSRRTFRMCSRSLSSSVTADPLLEGAAAGAAFTAIVEGSVVTCSSEIGTFSTEPRLRMTARSIKFFELSDIAGPVPPRESAHGVGWNRVDFLVHASRVLESEMANHCNNASSRADDMGLPTVPPGLRIDK